MAAANFSYKKVAFCVTAALISCVLNVFFLEKLISAEKNSSNLITASGFLLIAIDGLIFTSKFFTVKPIVPLRHNALLVFIFFLSNLGNNLAFKYHIPMTLHMIFKSGSLMSSLLLGALLLKRKYTITKYVSVVTITIGIILCTYASSEQAPSETAAVTNIKYKEFIIGLSLLLFTLFASSYMGVLQERLAARFGKHPRESLFYNHALPLPFFLFLHKDLAEQISIFNSSEPMEVPLIGVMVPYLWLLLACNAFFQYLCINFVFQLTTECTSLTVTLVITIRKFLSLLISVFYFGNRFTVLHWIGAGCVFGGSAMFTELHNLLLSRKKKD